MKIILGQQVIYYRELVPGEKIIDPTMQYVSNVQEIRQHIESTWDKASYEFEDVGNPHILKVRITNGWEVK